MQDWSRLDHDSFVKIGTVCKLTPNSLQPMMIQYDAKPKVLQSFFPELPGSGLFNLLKIKFRFRFVGAVLCFLATWFDLTYHHYHVFSLTSTYPISMKKTRVTIGSPPAPPATISLKETIERFLPGRPSTSATNAGGALKEFREARRSRVTLDWMVIWGTGDVSVSDVELKIKLFGKMCLRVERWGKLLFEFYLLVITCFLIRCCYRGKWKVCKPREPCLLRAFVAQVPNSQISIIVNSLWSTCVWLP